MAAIGNLVLGLIVVGVIVYSFFQFLATFGKGFFFMMSPENRKLPRGEQWRRGWLMFVTGVLWVFPMLGSILFVAWWLDKF